MRTPLIKWSERAELIKTMPMTLGRICDSVQQSLTALKYIRRDLLM